MSSSEVVEHSHTRDAFQFETNALSPDGLSTATLVSNTTPSRTASAPNEEPLRTKCTGTLEEMAYNISQPIVSRLAECLYGSDIDPQKALSNAVKALREKLSIEGEVQTPHWQVVLEATLDGFVPKSEKRDILQGGFAEIKTYLQSKNLWQHIEKLAQGLVTMEQLAEAHLGVRRGEITDGLRMYSSLLAARYRYVQLSDVDEIESRRSPVVAELDSAPLVYDAPLPDASEIVLNEVESPPIPPAFEEISKVSDLETAVRRIGELTSFTQGPTRVLVKDLRASADEVARHVRSLKAQCSKLKKWSSSIASSDFPIGVDEAVRNVVTHISQRGSEIEFSELISRVSLKIVTFGKTHGLAEETFKFLCGYRDDLSTTLAEKLRVIANSTREKNLSLQRMISGLNGEPCEVLNNAARSAMAVAAFALHHVEPLIEDASAQIDSAIHVLAQQITRQVREARETLETYAEVLAEEPGLRSHEASPLLRLLQDSAELEPYGDDVDNELDEEDAEEDKLPPRVLRPRELPSGESASESFSDLYDAMMNARVSRSRAMSPAPIAELTLADGRTVMGYAVFNEDRGTGRMINVDEEFAFDFTIGDLLNVRWWN